MPQVPTLLFLHGVGDGDQENGWRDTLDESLTKVGYPNLSQVRVIAPKYPNGLRGVDDDVPIPKVTVRAPRGDAAARHRRDYERRRTAMEVLLGADDRGSGRPGGDQIVPLAARHG